MVMQLSNETKKTLRDIKKLASTPLDKAFAMPTSVYKSDEIFELEKSRIFAESWLCSGRAESIPKHGDYFTDQINDQPVIVMRQKDGTIKAFANVCRHRMMQLLEGSGNCTKLVCPYHAWTYHSDGRLIGAPHMQNNQCFDKAKLGLKEVRCEVWLGWIYISLSENIDSVENQLSELAEVVAPYRMENYQQVCVEDHVWNTNWKQLTENFMEGYHLPVAHRATVGGYFPVEDTQFSERPPNPAFTYQTFTKTDGAPVGTAHKNNKRLKGKMRNTSVLPTIFPSHMITLAPDHFWYLSLRAVAKDKVGIRYGFAFAPEVLKATRNRNALIKKTKTFLDKVNEEDRFVTEGIWKGVNAGLSEPGPLSWLEQENHEFTQYVSRMLNSRTRKPKK